MDLTQYQAAKIVCPLLCDGNTCAANGMRPIHCRGWFPLPDRQNEVGSSSEDAGTIDAHAHTVGQGAENGLASELDERGLDGNRYELNSALAVAFDTPNAAELWANGEPVFERCKPHDTIRAT
ncbi:MAG TPA: hypothetical protein EYQ75_04525 [Planctomycetaceae bacterium]|nr:hypothetical protein [Planctomycetaceae bacterium]